MLLAVLLILVIFLILVSCDNKWICCIKNKITCSSADASEVSKDTEEINGPIASKSASDDVENKNTVDGYSHQDGLGLDDETLRESFVGNRDDISAWEPSTTDFANVGADTTYRTYAEDLKSNVDGVIIDSHQEYTEDSAYLASTGASHASTRDDFMPAVKFHGLPRAAHYSNPGARMGARTGQSETPDTVIDLAEHNTSGYIL